MLKGFLGTHGTCIVVSGIPQLTSLHVSSSGTVCPVLWCLSAVSCELAGPPSDCWTHLQLLLRAREMDPSIPPSQPQPALVCHLQFNLFTVAAARISSFLSHFNATSFRKPPLTRKPSGLTTVSTQHNLGMARPGGAALVKDAPLLLQVLAIQTSALP